MSRYVYPNSRTVTLDAMARMNRNRYGGSLNTYRRTARAARLARSRSRTMTQRKKRISTGVGVTEQHDARLIYKKRSMPRRMKKRWKSFRNKVLAVSEKDLGTQQTMFNTSQVYSNTTSGNQCIASCALFGLSSAISYYNDLRQIGTYLNNALIGNNAQPTGLSVEPSSKVIFKSAILDITIRNTSGISNGTAYVSSSDARMEVDVYELYMKHPGEETGATYNNIQGIFSTNVANTLAVGGGATTKISHDARGVTPFELSYALSRFGVKITRKTKYQISNGDQVTYQTRDPRRHTTVQKELLNQDGFNYTGLTRIVYIVGKLAPGIPIGPVGTSGNGREQLTIGITRKYTYKVENMTEDRNTYDTI